MQTFSNIHYKIPGGSHRLYYKGVNTNGNLNMIVLVVVSLALFTINTKNYLNMILTMDENL